MQCVLGVLWIVHIEVDQDGCCMAPWSWVNETRFSMAVFRNSLLMTFVASPKFGYTGRLNFGEFEC